MQHNRDTQTHRQILRGTWFVQKSDGTLYPYEEDTAAALDAAFFSVRGPVEEIQGVEVGERRFVYRAEEDGMFVEMQTGADTGQWVTRRYQPGRVELRSLSVLHARDEAGDDEARAGSEEAPALAAGADLRPAAPLVVAQADEARRMTASRVFYLQRGNGMLVAYGKEVCAALNAAYPPHTVVFQAAGSGVRIDEKRRVYRALEGGFAQLHSESGTVRWVTDIYCEGYLPLRTVTPLIDALHGGDSDGSYTDDSSSASAGGGGGGEPLSLEKIKDCSVWWKRHAQWGAKSEELIFTHSVQYPEVVSDRVVAERHAVRMLFDSLPARAELDSDEALFAAQALYSVGAGVVHYFAYSEGRAPLVRRLVLRGIHDSHARRCMAGSQRLSELPAWLTMVAADSTSLLSFDVVPEEETQLLKMACDMWKAAQALVERG